MPLRLLLPAFLLLFGCTATVRTTPPADAGPSEYFEVIVLKNAHCNEVTAALKAVFGEGGDARILAVHRTNSILIAGTPGEVAQLRDVIARLDEELYIPPPGAGD